MASLRDIITAKEGRAMKDGLRSNVRRRKIVEFLVANKCCTRELLAHEFHVSVRRIARDVVFLSSEVPIYTKSGNRGGIYILPQYKINSGFLTKEEKMCSEELADEVEGDKKVVLLEILERFAYISAYE